MVFRRHKGLWQALLVLIVVGVTLKFLYNYYKENEAKLKAANIRHHEILEETNDIKRELENMKESRNNLEMTLRTKALQCKKLKEDWEKREQGYDNESNRNKEKLNAMDSEYRMLKAKNDDLQIDYEHMQKSFDRLKGDHSKLDTEYRTNYKELKEKNEKIISALQKQVEHYQKQENSLQIKVQELQETIVQYQTIVAKLQTASQSRSKDTGNDQTLAHAPRQQTYRARRRRLVKGAKGMKHHIKGLKEFVNDDIKSLKQKKVLQNLGKLTENKEETEVQQKNVALNNNNNDNEENNNNNNNKNEANNKNDDNNNEANSKNDDNNDKVNENNKKNDNIALPKAGEEIVDVIQNNEDEKKKETNDYAAEKKDETVDKIEVVKENGKEEDNFKLDDQLQNLERKERQALVGVNNANIALERRKREADDRLNNDQKFDDQDAALQEGDENEDNVGDENEENDVLDKPDTLLFDKDGMQDKEENDEK